MTDPRQVISRGNGEVIVELLAMPLRDQIEAKREKGLRAVNIHGLCDGRGCAECDGTGAVWALDPGVGADDD